MGQRTAIEWTDATWNPIRGCSRVSEGCRHCYAEAIAARFSGSGQPYEGLATMHHGEARWTGGMRFVESALDLPLRWKKPRKIFVNSMSDLFHERAERSWIEAIFGVMALTQRHTFQVLTKRPERARAFLSDALVCARQCVYQLFGLSGAHATCDATFDWPLPNVWVGVSVEDQATADERIPLLLQTPATVRWISYEPALGPVTLRNAWLMGQPHHACQAGHCIPAGGRLEWVVAGGESGPGARPAHPDWFRAVRDQCQAAGVPFFFKQWGEHLPWDQEGRHVQASPRERGAGSDRVGKKAAGRLLDGREWNEFPSAAAGYIAAPFRAAGSEMREKAAP